MAWAHRIAREFQQVLSNSSLEIGSPEPYTNEQGLPGFRYECSRGNRKFYISQSRVDDPQDIYLPHRLCQITLKQDNVDQRKRALYINRDFGRGLRVETWVGKRWFQVFTPDNEKQPQDKFSNLISEIDQSSHF